MPNTLAHFLVESEGAVAKFISQAEKICGYPSEDTRLFGDMAAKIKSKTAGLGLDPIDTTNKELYYTLRSKAEKDSQLFDKLYGLNEAKQRANRTAQLFVQADGLPTVYALKKSIAKNLLKTVPPKQLMKKLGYRSLDSLIKREEVGSVFGAAYEVESSLWGKKIAKNLKNLTANDFEERSLELYEVGTKFTTAGQKEIYTSLLLGGISINSSESSRSKGLKLVLQILKASSDIEAWGYLVKSKRLRPDFGKFMAANANSLLSHTANFCGLPIHFDSLRAVDHSSLEKLAAVSLPLAWWSGTESLGSKGSSRPISFNLNDLIDDQLSGQDFGGRSTTSFQKSLWQKLVAKYLKYPSFEFEIFKKLSPEAELAEEFAVPDAEFKQLVRAI